MIQTFLDVNSKPLVNRKIVFDSLFPPTITSSYLAMDDPEQCITDTNGTATGSLVPTKYQVFIASPTPETKFYALVDSTGSLSVISASIKTGSACPVYFNLIDILKDPFSVKKLTLSPYTNYPYVFSGSVICLNSTSSLTDNNGSTTFDALIPGVIECIEHGKVDTTFYILLPSDGATYNAKDLLITKPQKGLVVKITEPNIFSAFSSISSSYALTASFALISGVSSSYALSASHA